MRGGRQISCNDAAFLLSSLDNQLAIKGCRASGSFKQDLVDDTDPKAVSPLRDGTIHVLLLRSMYCADQCASAAVAAKLSLGGYRSSDAWRSDW